MRTLVLAALVAGLGVATTSCGGSRAPAVANLGTTTTTARTTASGSTSAGSVGGSGGEASSGGSGKSGVPFTIGGGNIQQMTKFAGCMRANGEPSFPDPNAQGVISVGSNERSSVQFEQAMQACRKDLPGGLPAPAQQEHSLLLALALSACMRKNGVPDFPDPKSGVMHLGSGIDPNSPQFQKAQQICHKKLPGLGKG